MKTSSMQLLWLLHCLHRQSSSNCDARNLIISPLDPVRSNAFVCTVDPNRVCLHVDKLKSKHRSALTLYGDRRVRLCYHSHWHSWFKLRRRSRERRTILWHSGTTTTNTSGPENPLDGEWEKLNPTLKYKVTFTSIRDVQITSLF